LTKRIPSVFSILIISLACGCLQQNAPTSPSVIANGKMPNIAKDNSGNIHLVFGHGDSLLYSASSDEGKKFSPPEIIAIINGLSAGAMRGPQIACGDQGLIVTANNHAGDIFCFSRGKDLGWTHSVKVNDMDTVARENLMALAADKDLVYAVWLDLRGSHNAIYGSASRDGGKTWSKNKLIYASPDSTVCECCKPSVAVRENKVYVMFRNWLAGNRDVYLIKSDDGGISFGDAIKLGNGSWPLNGCPMDGGFLSVNKKGTVQTAWMRNGTVYSCIPGKPEFSLGEGRHCTVEAANNEFVFAWIENNHVIFLNSRNEKLDLGPGDLPMIRSMDGKRLICVWSDGENIRRQIIKI
jgi:hypothetical protein